MIVSGKRNMEGNRKVVLYVFTICIFLLILFTGYMTAYIAYSISSMFGLVVGGNMAEHFFKHRRKIE